MRYENYLWITIIALTFLGTTSEARTRRKIKKPKPQSDDPEVEIQNQQAGFDDYEPNYEDYTGEIDEDDDDNNRRKPPHLPLLKI